MREREEDEAEETDEMEEHLKHTPPKGGRTVTGAERGKRERKEGSASMGFTRMTAAAFPRAKGASQAAAAARQMENASRE